MRVSVAVRCLDASQAMDFKNALAGQGFTGVSEIVVDLHQVEFINSSGVGALLSLYRKLPPDNDGVILRGCQAPVRSVLELLRLHRVFRVES